MTTTLREQIAKSVTVEQSFALDFIAQHERKVIKLPELLRAFKEADMKCPANFAAGQLFAYCQYKQEMLVGPDGKKSRWWMPTSMPKAEAERILSVPVEF
jgi:hypothetical protein